MIDNNSLAEMPPELGSQVQERWQRFAAAEPATAEKISGSADLRESLPRVWAASEFVAGLCERRPALLAAALDRDLLTAAPAAAERRPFRPSMELPEALFMAELRSHRMLQMLTIAWRDLAGWAALEETLAALSALADECILAGLAFSARQMAARYGWPARDEFGERGELLVLAMGKLGAGELNFSSDIDLVFLYPGPGHSDGERSLEHETWFARQARQLIRMLDAKTEDGFVFRVDMRLRPFGDSGPLVMSLPAFEAYLQQHGRDWERYAYVKARAVSGTPQQQAVLEETLRPYVYRRYLDYGVFESLRAMKDKVARVSRRNAKKNDIKLGPGGIREIEFMVQSFQLIRGGQESELRTRGLLDALALLSGRYFDSDTAATLGKQYRFLRTLENRLQAMEDRQVHCLPEQDVARTRLAYAMHFGNWAELQAELDRRTRIVHELFAAIMVGPSPEGAPGETALAGVWEGSVPEEEGVALLADAGFQAPAEILAQLEGLRGSSLYRRMDAPGRQRLDTLLPLLLTTAAQADARPETWRRVVSIIEAVGRRSAYFALLNENRGVRERLLALCARSQLLVDEVSAHPVLLDELIDPRVFEVPPEAHTLAAQLARRMTGIDANDLDAQMDALRNFQRATVFRIALADLNGVLPVMKVSDRLTELAEAVLGCVLGLARDQVTRKHGQPPSAEGGAGFGIIGYGKLGGLELGYGSDLDIVFTYARAQGAQAHGAGAGDSSVFYTRIAQRIVHMLSTQTRSGRLYEVDTRLRPSGKSGLLVSELEAFAAYQLGEAWTWEHQALLRARPVAGDGELGRLFSDIRRRVLCRPRDGQELRKEIVKMRERMRAELDSSDATLFDLKQGEGGIADLEFLVQYLLLLNAVAHPDVLTWTDNIRQLECLANARLLSAETAETLTAIYRAYRKRLHRLTLDGASPRVSSEEFASERDIVRDIWRRELGTGSG